VTRGNSPRTTLRCPSRAPKDPLPPSFTIEAARSHPHYKHYLEPQAQCELDAGHGDGTDEHDVARRHENGCLKWWDPPILHVGAKEVA
jgi:hypothetical protein